MGTWYPVRLLARASLRMNNLSSTACHKTPPHSSQKHLGGVRKTYKLSPAKYRNNPDFRTCSQSAINLYISRSVQYYCRVLLTCGPCPGEQLLAVPQWVSSFKGEIPSLARLARIRQFDNQTWATEKTLAQKFSQAVMEM
jgi:hypothetical protein